MKLMIGMVLMLFGTSALAQTTSTTPEPDTPENEETDSALEEKPADGSTSATNEKPWNLSLTQVPSAGPVGEGVALGYSFGSWGSSFAQNLQLQIPITSWFSIVTHGVAIYENNGILRSIGGGEFEFRGRWDLGGGLGYRIQTPVYLNLIRIYGGGEVRVLVPTERDLLGDSAAVIVGGQFGFEFFASSQISYFIEIGGQAVSRGSDRGFRSGDSLAGATVMAGIMVYPF